MTGPVAAVLERHGEWRGAAFATEPLAQALLAKASSTIGLGVPDEVSSVDELAAELKEELVLRVVREGETGPGPTVVDFTGRPVVVDRKGKLAILDLEQQLGEMVRLGPLVVFSVLVVCTGNCCRSPMASGLLSKLLEGERVFAFSAGTDAPEGAPATRFALETAAELGADLSSHRAQQLVAAMVRNADLVLVMEEYHRTRVVEMVPDAAGRTKLLRDYPDGTDEIADPIGRSLEFYRETAAQMKPGLERAAEDVRQRLEVNSEMPNVECRIANEENDE